MKLFEKIVYGFWQLNVIKKSSILCSDPVTTSESTFLQYLWLALFNTFLTDYLFGLIKVKWYLSILINADFLIQMIKGI